MAAENLNTIPRAENRKSSLTSQKRRQSTLDSNNRAKLQALNKRVTSHSHDDLGIPVSDDESGNDQDEDDLRRIQNIGDYNPHLMAYLDHSESDGNSFAIASSSESDEGNGVDGDESSIEAEEEQAIRAEMGKRQDKNQGASGIGPVSIRRLSESHGIDTQQGTSNNDSDSESSDSDNSSWGNDFLDDYFDSPNINLWNSSAGSGAQPQQCASENTDFKGSHGALFDLDDGDDENGYLWQYFFSSDEEENLNNTNPLLRSRQRRASRAKQNQSGQSSLSNASSGSALPPDDSFVDLNGDNGVTSDEDLPLKGRGPLPADQITRLQAGNHVPSGDSTDEDDGVPPERKRKRARGAKAIEVLGSNSFSAPPPLLGSWRIRGDKNVGIIDGITTRTLSPPPPPPNQNYQVGMGPDNGNMSQGNTPQSSGETPRDPFEGLGEFTFTDFGNEESVESPLRTTSQEGQTGDDGADFSDLDLLELGDFINTENMSSDDNGNNVFEFDLLLGPDDGTNADGQSNQQQPSVSPYLYRNRLSTRNVPISAFRNRGSSSYVNNPAYPAESANPTRRRRSSVSGRRPVLGRDTYMTPFAKKRRDSMKKSRQNSVSNSARGGSAAQNNGYSNGSANSNNDFSDLGSDFLGELIELGAISPACDS